MLIRDYKSTDYDEVVDLLVRCKVEPPSEPSELNGLCLVAQNNEKIIGVMYFLVGESSKAYMDFLAIDEKHRGRFVYHKLLKEADMRLSELGVKKYMFHVEKYNHQTINQLYKYREKFRIKKLADLHYFLREMP